MHGISTHTQKIFVCAYVCWHFVWLLLSFASNDECFSNIIVSHQLAHTVTHITITQTPRLWVVIHDALFLLSCGTTHWKKMVSTQLWLHYNLLQLLWGSIWQTLNFTMILCKYTCGGMYSYMLTFLYNTICNCHMHLKPTCIDFNTFFWYWQILSTALKHVNFNLKLVIDFNRYWCF